MINHVINHNYLTRRLNKLYLFLRIKHTELYWMLYQRVEIFLGMIYIDIYYI